jgi:hypothetical protein
MTRKTAWMIGLGSSGLLAYTVWRKWMRFESASDSDDRMVTEASEDSFPASDAPSHTPMTGSRVGGY